MALSPIMRQLFRSIRSNNKKSERRDFIGESLNLAKTRNQSTHLVDAGHSNHHYSNSGEINAQEQHFEREDKGTSNANTIAKDYLRDIRLTLESQETFNAQNSTNLKDPATDNQHGQNTFGQRLRQPFHSFTQQGFDTRANQNDANESPNESPNEYKNQNKFEQESKRLTFSKPNLMAREDQNELPQSRTDGEHEAGEEGGSRNPFSKGHDQQPFSKIPRQYNFGQSMEPSELSIGMEEAHFDLPLPSGLAC
jgi:hypothetical protein